MLQLEAQSVDALGGLRGVRGALHAFQVGFYLVERIGGGFGICVLPFGIGLQALKFGSQRVQEIPAMRRNHFAVRFADGFIQARQPRNVRRRRLQDLLHLRDSLLSLLR